VGLPPRHRRLSRQGHELVGQLKRPFDLRDLKGFDLVLRSPSSTIPDALRHEHASYRPRGANNTEARVIASANAKLLQSCSLVLEAERNKAATSGGRLSTVGVGRIVQHTLIDDTGDFWMRRRRPRGQRDTLKQVLTRAVAILATLPADLQSPDQLRDLGRLLATDLGGDTTDQDERVMTQALATALAWLTYQTMIGRPLIIPQNQNERLERYLDNRDQGDHGENPTDQFGQRYTDFFMLFAGRDAAASEAADFCAAYMQACQSIGTWIATQQRG
jgi:hypothetical protein